MKFNWKKILRGTLISFGLLIGAAIALPFIFKDKIIAKVKKSINAQVNAKVDFKSVDISMFRHFPSVAVVLKDLTVIGTGAFEGVPLLKTDELDLSLDFWSVTGGGNPYKVNSVSLVKPFLQIVKLSDGDANYNITKPAKADAKKTDFLLNLAQYNVSGGEIIYDDRKLGFLMHIKGLEHTGSGNLTASVYDLDTKSTADSLTVSYGPVTYLSNAKVKLDALVNVDMKNMKFTLRDNNAIVNAMQLKFDGWLQMPANKDIVVDFKFKAPDNDFKNFLSIIPGAYTEKFKDVKASGRFNFDGFVKGIYHASGLAGNPTSYPAFDVTTNIENAAFQYPTLPMGVTGIDAKIKVAMPEGRDFDAFALDIPNFKMKLGQNPFEATLKLRTPISDPDIDTRINGTINLADVAKALPLESVQKLNGIITADVAAKTKMSYIDQKKYDQMNVKGAMRVDNMNIESKGNPAVFIKTMQMDFTPNNVAVNSFDAKLGKSDLQMTGTVDNILAYFKPDRTLTGNVKFTSAFFDANEWIKPSKPTVTNANKTPTDAVRPFDRFNFTMNGKMDKVLYDKYEITNSVAVGNFTPNKFIINNFATKIGNSDMSGKGTLSGIFDWLYDHKTLGGQLDLNAGMMDLNQFMTDKPVATTTNTATKPFVIPDNVDVTVNAKANRVLYTNMDMTNLNGTIVVKDKKAQLVNTNANMLGGQIALKGGYNTQDAAKPKFEMAMDLKNMDFQKTYTTFNTFQKLAPIANYIKGRFNTSLNFNGELGQDMMPNLQTLNVEGFLQTLQGILTGLKPLELIGEKLNIAELKNLEIKDTKNWLEVKNGTVNVKEFEQKVKDITLKISGSHSLTNEMNYMVKTRIPRKKLESNAVGAAAGSAYNEVLAQAAKLGLNIKNSEFVNVQFNITGSMLAPKLSMKLLNGEGDASLEQAAKDAANAAFQKARDSVQTRANEELQKAKDKAKAEADKITAAAEARAREEIERAKQKAIDEAKKKAGEIGGDAAKNAADKIQKELEKNGGDKVKTEADKLKEKLNKFDPFKKKDQ